MRKIIYFFIFVILVLIGLLSNQDYLTVALALVVYFYIGYLIQRNSSVHMMFFVGFNTFIFLPSLFQWYYLNISFSLFFVTSFVSAFFLLLTRKTVVKEFVNYGNSPKSLFSMACLLVCILVLSGLGRVVAPVFAFLIILLSLSFQQNDIKNNAKYLSIFIIAFLVYSIFYWSGFGRLVVIGWLLLALLQFSYSIGYNVNKYVFGLLPGFAATLMGNRDLFRLQFSSFEDSLDGSAYSPYRLASSFVDHFNNNGYDIVGFLEQMIFIFFVFVPRSIWPDKPYGFGFEYTARHLADYLVTAGHSIASTLIGDHLYYLGYFGVITSLMLFSILAFIVNRLYAIKGLNGNGVLIFSASMMALVWGGVTSFSARVALPTIVFLLFFTLLRPLLTKKTRIVWRS